MNPRILTAAAFFLFLISPFLVLVYKFPLQISLDSAEFIWALKNTLYQAALSAAVSLVLGIWLALGLVSLGPRWRKRAEVISLLPNFLPPLFTLLVAFYWIDPFPIGILGVAFIHALINFGLVGVSLGRSIEGRLTHFAEVAYIGGATKRQFFRKILIPSLKKDFLALFLFVFSICFSSFSVPLIVGGGRGTTIEVLIYEKIRLSMEWGGAVLLSAFQLIVLAGLSALLLKAPKVTATTKNEMSWYGHMSGVFLLGIFSVLYIWGYGSSVITGFSSLIQFTELQMAIVNSALGTLYVGLATGFLVFGILAIIAFTQSLPYMKFILRSYVAPSTTLTGFAFLVFGPNEGIFSYVKIPIALSMLFAGPLFRMGWENEIEKVKGQLLVADTLGAKPFSAFRKIAWPQIRERASLLAGLAAAWACGDFALTRILAYKDMTLGLMTETLMSTYRLNMASVLSFGILICGLICFLFFWSFQYVYRRKSL